VAANSSPSNPHETSLILSDLDERTVRRRSVLWEFGAQEPVLSELLTYCETKFEHSDSTVSRQFPLPDEPFVPTWENYEIEARSRGAVEALRERLVQWQFPIREGISQTDGYRAATRKGKPPAQCMEATGLVLKAPDQARLTLHITPAGRIPVIIVPDRDDFVAIVRALTMRNEPLPVPASMGATMVAGYNNWDRIRTLRRHWEASHPGRDDDDAWEEEFKRLIPRRELYQDRFMILSDGPYSGVPAEAMGLTEEAWREISLIIRRDHECCHYFTRRVFSSMRNHLLDELIADYAGITVALGYYRADWFLRFVGLEEASGYREGGRLQNYRGLPALSDAAFEILQALVRRAATNLERFDQGLGWRIRSHKQCAALISALTTLGLEEMAADDGTERMEQALGRSINQ